MFVVADTTADTVAMFRHVAFCTTTHCQLSAQGKVQKPPWKFETTTTRGNQATSDAREPGCNGRRTPSFHPATPEQGPREGDKERFSPIVTQTSAFRLLVVYLVPTPTFGSLYPPSFSSLVFFPA